MARAAKEALFGTYSRGGAFVSGLFRGEPLLEVARRGLVSVGVSESDQELYAIRIAKTGTVDDALEALRTGRISSDQAQEQLVSVVCGSITIVEACLLIRDGNVMAESAQVRVIDSIQSGLSPELAYGLLNSGKASDKLQSRLAGILFDKSTNDCGHFTRISGRISNKLLSSGKITSLEAQEKLSAIMLQSTDSGTSQRAFELLLSGNVRSDTAQAHLSMLITDPEHACNLLSSGMITSRIAKSRLYDKTPESERATIPAEIGGTHSS